LETGNSKAVFQKKKRLMSRELRQTPSNPQQLITTPPKDFVNPVTREREAQKSCLLRRAYHKIET
jgi:hypothetical protein